MRISFQCEMYLPVLLRCDVQIISKFKLWARALLPSSPLISISSLTFSRYTRAHSHCLSRLSLLSPSYDVRALPQLIHASIGSCRYGAVPRHSGVNDAVWDLHDRVKMHWHIYTRACNWVFTKSDTTPTITKEYVVFPSILSLTTPTLSLKTIKHFLHHTSPPHGRH